MRPLHRTISYLQELCLCAWTCEDLPVCTCMQLHAYEYPHGRAGTCPLGNYDAVVAVLHLDWILSNINTLILPYF